MKKTKLALLFALVAAFAPAAVACTGGTQPEPEPGPGPGPEPQPEHTHSYDGVDWVLASAPTLTTTGSATRECKDHDYTDTFTLPKLDDTTFYDKASTAASYSSEGFDLYTPKDEQYDFEFKVTTDAKLAPYANRTYYALAFDVGEANKINKAVGVETAWKGANIALDGNVGVGSAYPFRNEQVTITTEDAETGEIKLAFKSTAEGHEDDPAEDLVGFVNSDPESNGFGVIVYKSGSYYFVLTPYTETEPAAAYSAGTTASAFAVTHGEHSGKALAVSYKYGEEADDVVDIFIDEAPTGEFDVYYNVKFTSDKAGETPVAANACFNAPEVFVTGGGADVHFGFNGDVVSADDGLAGTYTHDTDSVTLNGVGTVTVGEVTVKYSVVGENKIGAVIGGEYIEYTLDKAAHTYTSVAPKAKATFVFENATAKLGDVDLTSETAVDVSIKTEFDMPTVTESSGYKFFGWFEDETFETPVTKHTFASADATKTFYAKVEAFQTWWAKDTAADVAADEDGIIKIEGETDANYMKYWAKFTVSKAGTYKIFAKAPTKKGGADSINYARYAIVTESGEAAGVITENNKSTNLSFSDTTVNEYSLAAGTYYVEVHLGGVVTGSDYNKECYGSFSVEIVKGAVKSYTVGTQLTGITVPWDGKAKDIYTVTLEQGKSYKITVSNVTGAASIDVWTKAAVYSDEACKTTVSGSSVTGRNANPEAKTFTVSETNTYYIALMTGSLDFKLEEIETKDPVIEDGATYYKSTYDSDYNDVTLTVTFTNATSGTITVKVDAGGWGDKNDSYSFTAGAITNGKITITPTKTGSSSSLAAIEITLEYNPETGEVTAIKFPSRCSISDLGGFSLSLKN